MQLEGDLFTDIVIIFVVAFVGGLLARVLRFPILLGYLAVGTIIGPNVLEVVGNEETVLTLAEFGVILLLFAVGVEISFRDLRQLGRVVVLGGMAQIVATIGLAYPLGLHLGWSPQQALVLGLVASLSSTMVVLKTLTDRGELGSVHGRVLVGILVVQDLAFIPMIAILPSLSGDGGSALVDLGLGLLKAAAVLGLMALLGGRIMPWILNRVASLGSREIFILAVVAITFASAGLTDYFELSAALGAFVAGLLLSESDFGHRALSEIIPLRDTFAALFFVSLGMLTDPIFLWDNIGTVLAVVALVMVVKLVLTAGLVRGFGYLPHTALLTGFGMVQVGEFSFILADSARTLDIVDEDFLFLVVVSAVLTMAATPLIFAGGHWAVVGLGRRVSFLRPYRPGQAAADEPPPILRTHVIVCGMGRVGSLVAQALEQHRIPTVVIDLDPQVVNRTHGRGFVAINGSSADLTVLEMANVKQARLLIIAIGDSASATITAQHSLSINPKLDVVARVRWREEGERLQHMGVREVVWPEMEAGLEILRHSLLRYRTSRREVNLLVRQLRDHLEFTAAPEAEEALPPEGMGDRPD